MFSVVVISGHVVIVHSVVVVVVGIIAIIAVYLRKNKGGNSRCPLFSYR
jgi:hypothetical protein